MPMYNDGELLMDQSSWEEVFINTLQFMTYKLGDGEKILEEELKTWLKKKRELIVHL